MELMDEAYAILQDSAKRATYDLENAVKTPETLPPIEMSEAEKIVNSWGHYFTTEEQAYIDKIRTINTVIRAFVAIMALIFLWLVITFRWDLAFLMMFGILFLRVMVGSIYKIKNPPPPIDISAVE